MGYTAVNLKHAIVVFNESNEAVIENSVIQDRRIFSLCSENSGPDAHCDIVRSHSIAFVRECLVVREALAEIVRLIVDDLLEELNQELECSLVKLRHLCNDLFDSFILMLFRNLVKLSNHIVLCLRNDWLLELHKESLEVVGYDVRIIDLFKV